MLLKNYQIFYANRHWGGRNGAWTYLRRRDGEGHIQILLEQNIMVEGFNHTIRM